MAPVEPIVISRVVDADPEAAWAAITEPGEVARWFTTALPVLGVGAPYRLEFGDSVVKGFVTELEPGRRFSHTWHWADQLPGQETLVTWEIAPTSDGDGAVVTLTHGGWAEAAADQATRDDHAGYWEDHLDALAELLASD